jgi:hypothetical protein
MTRIVGAQREPLFLCQSSLDSCHSGPWLSSKWAYSASRCRCNTLLTICMLAIANHRYFSIGRLMYSWTINILVSSVACAIYMSPLAEIRVKIRLLLVLFSFLLATRLFALRSYLTSTVPACFCLNCSGTQTLASYHGSSGSILGQLM